MENTNNQQLKQGSSSSSQTRQDSPQLIKIMADNESNKRVLCHWISFFFLVVIIYILTFTIPEPLMEFLPAKPLTKQNGERGCPESMQDDPYLAKMCNELNILNPVFGAPIYNLNETNQFLVLQLNFTVSDDFNFNKVKKIDQQVDFLYSYYLMNDDETINKIVEQQQKHHINVICEKDDVVEQLCQSRWIIYVPEIKFKNILFRIEFENADEIQKTLDLTQIQYSYIYVNSKYTNYLIGVKYTFMTISIFALLGFFLRLRKLAQQHWIIEQKFILALSVALIFFNDPFYALTILNPNMTNAFFSVLWLSSFLVLLFIFWIVALKRVVEDNARKMTKTFNYKLIAFGVVMWLFLLITYVGFSYEYQQHPGTEFYDEFKTEYEIFKYTGIVLITVFFLYLIYNYFRIGMVYKTRIWRHRLFSVFTLYFILAIMLFMYTGSPHVYSSYGERIFLFVAILNLYVYYMQFMYSPSDAGLQEATQTQQLEFPQQNQVYEMLDESIQIQEFNFENTPEKNQNAQFQQQQQLQQQRQADNQSEKDSTDLESIGTNIQNQQEQQQQQQQNNNNDDDFQLEIDDDDEEEEQGGETNQQKGSNINEIYENA